MKIANMYNHLNAREYLIVNKGEQFEELKKSIESVDANQYLKLSCEAKKLGQVFYSQSLINTVLAGILNGYGWSEKKVQYYVTGDEATTREIVNIYDKEKQKAIIEEKGLTSYLTFNQVDFEKDKIALEVQFGKYFSVAYDLHVKHTLFYSRNDIDVGIEVIPTKAMEEHMDSGVPWFENEVTNVIREGRTNPPVPILILGIQPDEILSKEPMMYTDEALIKILENSDIRKYRSKVADLQRRNRITADIATRIQKIDHCLSVMGV